jgi:hypothetical protein
LVRTKTLSNGPDGGSAAFSKDDFHPSPGSAGPEIITVRAEAPRDCCEQIEKLVAREGFATSGIKERKEQDGTWRFYFTAPVRQFRQLHGDMR